MITIPSAELTGILGDVCPFMSPAKDDVERRCVQLRWDGEMLHASAIDGIRVALSSWHPDDMPTKPVQAELGVDPGGADEPWSIVVEHDDVKHLLQVAKPIKELEYVPLYLTCGDGMLQVKRLKQYKVPGFGVTYDGMDHETPDVRTLLDAAEANVEPTKEIWFNAVLLADFAKVRQRGGPMKLVFGGAKHPTLVEIGTRFRGAIVPVREMADEPTSAPAVRVVGPDEIGDDMALLKEAVKLVAGAGTVTASGLQRKLRVGFAKAGRLMGLMEARQIVGPYGTGGHRDVLIDKDDADDVFARLDAEDGAE